MVGKDKEGIVAIFTNFAFSIGGNIEKVNQNVIKGLFWHVSRSIIFKSSRCKEI